MSDSIKKQREYTSLYESIKSRWDRQIWSKTPKGTDIWKNALCDYINANKLQIARLGQLHRELKL